MEHHANIVPWHMLAAERGIELRWLPVDDDGLLVLDDLDRILEGAKVLAVTCMSNVLGTLTPMATLAAAAHAAGAIVVADACQSVPHLPTDVIALGADLLAFSAHKMLGPTGIGVLWGHAELLDSLPPFLGGGEMILDVRKDGFTPNDIPWRFEAGTPPITEAIGLGAAVDYLRALGMDAVREPTNGPDPAAPSGAALRSSFGADIPDHPGPPGSAGGAASLITSPSATSTRTTSPRSSTSTGSACAPVTTAPSPSCGASGWPRPPEPRSPSTTTRPMSTRWSRRSTQPRSSSRTEQVPVG